MKSLRLLGVLCVGLMLVVSAACTTRPGTGGAPSQLPAADDGDPLGGVPAAGTIAQDGQVTPSGCVKNVGPGDNIKITGCGAGLTYSVTVPQGCLQVKCGLVFDIHGMTMSAASQDGGTNMREIGKREKYIVVQPTASGGNPDGTGIQGTIWDFGSGTASPAVKAFIDTAINVWKVEKRRVHVMGFSMGGSMTWWLRCHTGDTLASVAPMSFSNTSGGRCPNVMTPTIYQMGGAGDSLSGDTSMTNGFSGTMHNMIDAYGLSNPQLVAQGNGYTWNRFTKGKFVFETLVHNYKTTVIGGHCIFGAPKPGLLCSCKNSQPIKEGENAMQFFKKHPKGA